MFNKSLKFQILFFVIPILISGAVFLYYVSANNIKKTVDVYQELNYQQKLQTIIQVIDNNYNKLQKTGQIDVYEKAFKKFTLQELKNIYYLEENSIYPYILDSNNEIILHPIYMDKKSLEYSKYLNLIKKIKQTEGSLYYEFNGIKKWALVKQYEKWNWTIVYSMKADDKYSILDSFKNSFFSLALLIVFITSIFIVFVVSKMLKPIEELTKEAIIISNGDFDTNLKISKYASKEILDLSSSFSKMRVEIKNHFEELKSTNKNLEKIVFKRTKKLQKNINYLKQTQVQLVESEKMASLGGLVAGISHEINTPVGIGLTGITHFLDITNELKLKHKNGILSEDDFNDYLQTSCKLAELINSNLNKTASLIKSFKQIAIDQTSEIKREFNIKEYFEDILLSIHSLSKKAKVNIILKGEKNLFVNSYPGMYSQVISNLVINSIQHGFKNQENKKISINIVKRKKHFLIIYKNNGDIIPEKNISKIFEPFFTTNRENGGSGLGLNIIYNIITKSLNGQIKCLSKKRYGVYFIIKIRYN